MSAGSLPLQHSAKLPPIANRGWNFWPEQMRRVKEYLDTEGPQTLRGLGYMLWIEGRTTDMRKSELVKLGQEVSKCRKGTSRSGVVIGWDEIIESSRPEYLPGGLFSSLREFLDAEYFHRHWEDQPEHVVVLSEKDTVSQTMKPVIDKWQVPLYITRGYSSLTLGKKLADVCEEHPGCHFIFLGDHDVAGLDIYRAIQKELDYHGAEYSINRIGVHLEDKPSAFPWLPVNTRDTKKEERREYLAEFGNRCVEIDALPSKIFRKRLENEIREHVDMAIWEQSVEQEADDQAKLAKFIEATR